jgi:hypothetical protein
MLAVPLKGAISSAFGNSMITEKFSQGINIEAFTDMGGALKSIFTMLKKGLIFLLLINFILNAFLSAGLFRVLWNNSYSSEAFWSSGARNFSSFLVIEVIIDLIILVMFLLILVLPLSFMISGGNISDYAIMKAGVILVLVFFMVLAVILLAADYARIWQTRTEGNRCFSAIGYGFGQTFRTFRSSWSMMILVMIIQYSFLLVVAVTLAGMIPTTSTGVLLFFLLSQAMFFIRLMFKALRYGSVISLIE